MTWQERAEALWNLLDDISSAADACHPADSPYYRAVEALTNERNKLASSLDGYNLTWKENPEPIKRLI